MQKVHFNNAFYHLNSNSSSNWISTVAIVSVK